MSIQRKICLGSLFLFISALSQLIGCSGSRVARVSGEDASGELVVDAYLFDAQLRKNGKPTSVRIDMFRTDSLVGFSGRGYLGKGAFKGRLDPDSITVYFPSTNEYLRESVADLLNSVDCTSRLTLVPLLEFFRKLPDDSTLDSGVVVSHDYRDADEPEFTLSPEACPWKLWIQYDRQNDAWTVREFEFDDGGDIRLKGKRRVYKSRVSVSSSRFRVEIPGNAIRIIP